MSEQGATMSEQGATMSEQGATMSEQGATISALRTTLSEQGATNSEQCATISDLRTTISDQGATITKTSGHVSMLCKLQAVTISIQIMSDFIRNPQDHDARDPPQHALKANQTGTQLSDLLTTVMQREDVNHTIDLIDSLWLYRHKVTHPEIPANAAFDDLIHVLNVNRGALDEMEELALCILEKCDLIGKAPRCRVSKPEKKEPPKTQSSPVKTKAQQHSRRNGSNKATERPPHPNLRLEPQRAPVRPA
jgi:hypothetical protein